MTTLLAPLEISNRKSAMGRRTHGSGSVYSPKNGYGRITTMELPPDPATGKRRRLTARGETAAVAKLRL